MLRLPVARLFDAMVQPLVEMIVVERRDEQHPAYSKMEGRVAGRARRRLGAGVLTADLLDAIAHLDHLNVATRILHAAVSLCLRPGIGPREEEWVKKRARD